MFTLFFNVVPTDVDAFVVPLHEVEELLFVKLRVLVTDELANGGFNFCIACETLPSQRLLQSKEELEIAERQVGIRQ